MTRRIAYALLICSLLGLIASSTSAWVHYRLLRDPGYTSFCSINATWNCASVYESRFGAFQGIPVAVAGVIWFWVALLLSWAGVQATGAAAAAPEPATRKKAAPLPKNRRPAEIASYIFALSIVGLAFVLYFAYASFFVLKIVCVLCLATYVAVVGIFLLSGSAGSDITMRSLPGRALRDLGALTSRPVALALVAASIVGAVALVAYFPRQVDAATAATAAPAPLAQVQQSEFEKWYTTQPRVPIPVADDGAKVVVIKFQDFLCPPCRQTYMDYKPVLAKWQASHPGAVKFIERDYPLDPECNINTPGGQHAAACEAAAAHRMADEHGKGSEMEAWLYDNQPVMTPDMVKQGVREIGKVADFDARYQRTLELVKGDIALGKQLGVQSTPTFFVNGVRIPGLRAEFFDAAIAYELKLAGVLK